MSQETTSRRDRVVMALGLCALLLFAANLLTLVKRHFFDDHGPVHRVVVHEFPAPPAPPAPPIVSAPRVKYHFHVTAEQTARTEALLAMKERLLEEARRLTDEAARLADAGHADASLSLEQTVEVTRAQLRELERRLEQLPDRASPDVDVQVEVVDPSTS